MRNKLKCTLCESDASERAPAFDLSCLNCCYCGTFYIDERIVDCPSMLDDQLRYDLLCAARERMIRNDGDLYILWDEIEDKCKAELRDDSNNSVRTLTSFPSTIQERASRLLSNLIAKTETFGQTFEFDATRDYPLAYARNANEFDAYVDLLDEQKFIKIVHGNNPYKILNAVTALGFEHEHTSGLSDLTVFISSTCYDLKDCRSELARYLESVGCIVLMSDDPLRFEVSSSVNSIQSCLANIETADVVVCLIDQRYGGTLPSPYEGKSATRVEVDFAKKEDRPIYFFIRKEAFTEFSFLKRDPSNVEIPSKWVEPVDIDNRVKWVEFVKENIRLPDEPHRSNWFDQFDSVVDLKRIVAKRLKDHKLLGRRSKTTPVS